jgi:hypothetical protein
MKFFCVQRRIEPKKGATQKQKKREFFKVVVFVFSKKPDFFNKRII